MSVHKLRWLLHPAHYQSEFSGSVMDMKSFLIRMSIFVLPECCMARLVVKRLESIIKSCVTMRLDYVLKILMISSVNPEFARPG